MRNSANSLWIVDCRPIHLILCPVFPPIGNSWNVIVAELGRLSNNTKLNNIKNKITTNKNTVFKWYSYISTIASGISFNQYPWN